MAAIGSDDAPVDGLRSAFACLAAAILAMTAPASTWAQADSPVADKASPTLGKASATLGKTDHVFTVDYFREAPGGFPASLQRMHGSMAVVEAQGQRWLEATSKSTFAVALGAPLAKSFAVEFDVTLPPNGLIVYFAERWGVSERHLFNGSWPHPFVVLSPREVGIRERPFYGGAVRAPEDVLGRTVANGEVVKLRIEGEASSLKVLLNGRPVETLSVVLPRTDRIFIETTGDSHTAAQRSLELIPTRIGAITVSSGSAGPIPTENVSSGGRGRRP